MLSSLSHRECDGCVSFSCSVTELITASSICLHVSLHTYLSLNSLLYMLLVLMQSENQAISESYFALGSIFSGNFYAPGLLWTTFFL